MRYLLVTLTALLIFTVGSTAQAAKFKGHIIDPVFARKFVKLYNESAKGKSKVSGVYCLIFVKTKKKPAYEDCIFRVTIKKTTKPYYNEVGILKTADQSKKKFNAKSSLLGIQDLTKKQYTEGAQTIKSLLQSSGSKTKGYTA